MANTFKKALFTAAGLCLLHNAMIPVAMAGTATTSISQQIDIKNHQLNDAEKQVTDLTRNIDIQEKEKKQIDLDIKRYSLDVKRLSLETPPDENTKKALNTAQFEVKRAEFNLGKKTQSLEKLYANREEARTQKRVYNLQIEQLKEQLVAGTSGR